MVVSDTQDLLSLIQTKVKFISRKQIGKNNHSNWLDYLAITIFDTKKRQYQDLSWFGDEKESEVMVEVGGLAGRGLVSCYCSNPLDVDTLWVQSTSLPVFWNLIGIQPCLLFYIFITAAKLSRQRPNGVKI